ncbi:putative ubiquitin family protein [Golovinomyces cichoracearum]|uniref:Putative ubiquitin family protein n=1 Tax=Golovinomyces cichoracearum TaxID=62708 RepID=A0A420J9E8_9PEZI|nr:putative ubiquitin family protein [Golovinomyces cichoracearum]
MSEANSRKSLNVTKTSGKSNEDTKKNSTFPLQIVSPSVGIPQMLEFRELSVNLKVKDLKTLIRDSLVCRPSEKLQRLIHRGRMLTRETETMLEIFGEEVLSSSVVQVIHLVLPPALKGTDNACTNDKKATSIPAQQSLSYDSPVQQAAQISIPIIPILNQNQGSQVQQQFPGPQDQQQIVLGELEELQNLMGQRLIQLQRETQRLNQEIHSMGAQALLRTKSIESHPNEYKVQHSSNRLSQRPTSPSDLSNTPSALLSMNYSSEVNLDSRINDRVDAVATRERENVDMQQSDQLVHNRQGPTISAGAWKVPVNEINSNSSNQSDRNHQQSSEHLRNSYNDVHSILRNADRSSVKNQSTNQYHSTSISEKVRSRVYSSLPKSNSSTSLAVALTPINPNFNPSMGETSGTNGVSPSSELVNKPMVYILSSPSGPRAILMSNAQTFFTPSRNPGPFRYSFDVSLIGRNSFATQDRYRPLRQQVREQRNANVQTENTGPAPPQDNLRAGGIGLQVGQVLWLIARLVVLFLLFTAGNSSWTRWLMASGIAFIVLIAFTGFLNGVVQQVWSPIRRHLESLVPLGPVHNQNVPIQPNGVHGQAGDEERIQMNLPEDINRNEPNPLEYPSRGIEQQVRSNSELLMTQIRRLEQSLILFVASLVPGVSERHIAHREALANREAERQQQLLEATAQRATRVNTENSETRQPENIENTETNAQSQIDSSLNQEDAPQAEPLVQL